MNNIRTVPNFPKTGIMFKDITPLLADPQGMQDVIKYFTIRYKGRPIDKIVGIESRGFIFGAILAYQLNKPFVIIRKPNKLPAEKKSIEYSLEYGTDILEIHKDSILPGENVVIVDDLLATGGTANAAAQLIEKLGGKVLELAFVINLKELKKNLDYPTFSLLDL